MKYKIFIITLFAALAFPFHAAALENAMIPFSGTHGLVQHKFYKGCKSGKTERLIYSKRGLTVSSRTAGSAGVYTSEIIKTKFGANEMVLTWNADVPAGSWLRVQFRVDARGNEWSGWYDMGDWGSATIAERNTTDPVYGTLKVDQLAAAAKFNSIQYRIEFHQSPEGKYPVLRLVTISYSHVGEGETAESLMRAPGGKDVSLDVPWFSQLRPEDVDDPDMISAGVCAPTSVAMVLNHYGLKIKVSDVARRAFDPVAKIFGNWAFLSATAGDLGFDAWVQRFSSWKEVRKLVDSGTPVIISIAYPKRTFKELPDKFSLGHLLVVRGFTKSGDVICNDPGTAHREIGESVVYRWDELGTAFFGHGGVGIVIRKPQ